VSIYRNGDAVNTSTFEHLLDLYWMDIVNLYVENHLKGARNSAPQTVTGYLYDLRTYLEFYREEVNRDLNSLEFDKKTIRDFVIYLRKKNLSDSTIERRLNGIFAFWQFLYIDFSYPAPVKISETGVRLKKRFKETEPLAEENYKTLLKRAIDDLRTFAEI
jgi:site-specific recombinase XerD